MPESVEVKVPDIGDFDSVDVVEVLVSAGDVVAVDDSLITLESDKATMDIPATDAGKVREIKVKVGDKIAQDAVILTLDVEARQAAEPAQTAESTAAAPAVQDAVQAPAAGPAAPVPATPAAAPVPAPPSQVVDERAFNKAYASPSVRRFARELGVDLSKIRGTGRKDRILKEDVQGFVKKVMADGGGRGSMALPDMPVIDFSKFGPIERQPLSRIKKISATNLHRSWLHVPHVTQNDTADITELEAFRQLHKAEAKAKGYSLTPLTFIMKAAVAALKKFPAVNASLDPDGEHLIYKNLLSPRGCRRYAGRAGRSGDSRGRSEGYSRVGRGAGERQCGGARTQADAGHDPWRLVHDLQPRWNRWWALLTDRERTGGRDPGCRSFRDETGLERLGLCASAHPPRCRSPTIIG